MTDTELKSCIGTIEMLRRLAYNIHGVMDVIDADNCEKIIKVLSDIPKYKDAYNKGWNDGAKASYEHLKMCEEEQSGDLISRQAVLDALYELCDTGETLIENPWRDNPHIDALVDTVEQLPSVNPQEPKWIPVSERLPEKNVWVLTTFTMANDKNDIDIKRINRWNGQWEDEFDFCNTVIAWMPLPPCYEPQTESEDKG